MRAVRSVSVSPAEGRGLIVENWRGQWERSLAVWDVLGQVLGSLVRSQEICVNLLEVSATDKVIDVDVGFTENFLDNLDISVIVVVEESESLGSFKSKLSLNTSVELVSEGFEIDNELDVQTGSRFCLLEEDNLDEGVDVGTIQVQIDGDQELLESENGETDARDFLALGSWIQAIKLS